MTYDKARAGGLGLLVIVALGINLRPILTTTVIYAEPATTALQAQPTQWEAAPAVERVDTAAAGCLCPCRCNGQRPCTCSYPCGSEYALRDEDFALNRSFASYADAQNTLKDIKKLDNKDAWLLIEEL